MNIKINLNLKELKKKHENNKNQVIFHTAKCKNKKIIENIINNFLVKYVQF